MDMELIKPATEDQMEMMMMLEMDKLPEFYNSLPDVPELHSIDFSGGSTGPVFDAPTTVTTPSLVPLSSTPIHEPAMPPTIYVGATGGRLGNPGELLGASIFSSPVHKRNSMAAMREMIFRIAAMQPIHIDPESVKPQKRRNVKISKDPQSVAARHRRERISERIRILQRLVPGGTKMDTASMLDEAIQYVKFLKNQVQSLERAAVNRHGHGTAGLGIPAASSSRNYAFHSKAYQPAGQMFSPAQLLS